MLKSWFLAGCLVASTIVAAPFTPEKAAPADAMFFVVVPDWTAAQKALRQNPFGQFLNDPAMRPFREKFVSRFDSDIVAPLQKELGITLTNWTGMMDGAVSLAIIPEGEAEHFLFVADTRSHSNRLATELAAWRKKWSESGRTARTVTLRGQEFTTVIWKAGDLAKTVDKLVPDVPGESKQPATAVREWTLGQAGSLLLASDSPAQLEKMLARLGGASAGALQDVPAFSVHAAQFRTAKIYGWANLQPAIAKLKAAQAGASKGKSADGEDQPAMSIPSLTESLGIGAIESIALSVDELDSGTLLQVKLRVPEASRRGLFKVLALEPRDAAPPAFVPADVLNFSRVRMDLPATWARLETALTEAFPPAAGFLKLIMGTAGKEKDPNFDLRESLINRLGDDIVSYDRAAPTTGTETTEPPSLTLIAARDADQAASAIKAITSIMPPEMSKYREREFLGRTIYSFNMPTKAGPDGPAKSTTLTYSASGGYVAMSSDATMVEEFLRSNTGGGRSLRDRAGLSQAAEKVGGMNQGFFGFENQLEHMRWLFEAAKKDQLKPQEMLDGPLGMVGGQSSVFEWVDVSLLPRFEQVAKYFSFGVSGLTTSPDGYLLRTFTPVPPGLKK